MIMNIDVNKIYPHPRNPRKNVGDVTELAASIVQNGVLQNLTVIPRVDAPSSATAAEPSEAEYTVVIGHRRLAAAKFAGLTEVPCTVTEMDERQQLATMLLENIQRQDLTPIEEAEGFQMMLDLGETVASIAEQTGFSESTIRHRVKLSELDRKALEKSQARGGTLQDYMKLEKIKDLERRNKVLGTIGTSSFEYQLTSALQDEERLEKLAQVAGELSKFAKLVTDRDTLHYVNSYHSSSATPIVAPDDIASRQYFYLISNYNITLLTDTAEAQKEDPAVVKKNQEREDTRKQLEAIRETMYQLRSNFVHNTKVNKKNLPSIALTLLQRLTGRHYINIDLDDFAEAANMELRTDEESDGDQYVDISQISASPEKALLALAYCATEDSSRNGFFNYQNKHVENTGLDEIYIFLTSLGYEMSDEEKQIQDGTHLLFAEDVAKETISTDAPVQTTEEAQPNEAIVTDTTPANAETAA